MQRNSELKLLNFFVVAALILKVTDVYYSDHDEVLCSIPFESVSLTT